MTEEEFDLSYLLGRYGTMANLINEDFSQSIEEMENRPNSKNETNFLFKRIYLKKIEEGPFFRISFYKMIYIFLKSLSQEISNETFPFVKFLFVDEI